MLREVHPYAPCESALRLSALPGHEHSHLKRRFDDKTLQLPQCTHTHTPSQATCSWEGLLVPSHTEEHGVQGPKGNAAQGPQGCAPPCRS